MVTVEDIVIAARGLVGVRFQHQGRTLFGLDCIGVPIVIGQRLGLLPRLLRIPNYGRMPSPELVEQVNRYMIEVQAPIGAPRAGTMVVIAWNKIPSHVAICTGPTLVHAFEQLGRVVEHGYTRTWQELTHSVWAFPKVRYE